MGTCCSKIDKQNGISSFRGSLHPAWEQFQAAHSSCQFCQVNELAGHLRCCMCETCQRESGYCVKGLGDGRSYREAMCSLCAADVYDAHFQQQVPYLSSQPCGALSDEDVDATPCDPRQCNYLREHSLEQNYSFAGRCAAMQGHLVHGHNKDALRGNRAFERDLLAMDDRPFNFPEHEDEMQHFGSLPAFKTEDQDALLSSGAVCGVVGNSRRLSNIDDSDGIKLEVRYKHMLPHDTQIVTASPHDANVLKRARSQDEDHLTGDLESSRSIRRRKSFQITGLEEEAALFEYSLCTLDCEDELDNDDEFHDITVGVSIDSWERENGQCCEVPIRDLQVRQERLQCKPDYVTFMKSDSTELFQPLYLMSEENMQFISRKEREGAERADSMTEEDKISSKLQALSVVATGDAILFTGSNSDELHLIPSVAIQHSKAPLSSPKQKLGPRRIVSPERYVKQGGGKAAPSVGEIICLLESGELNEDDLFSLLIDSCAKSSASSSPSSSSTETTNSWSSSLSSSSLSSSSTSSSSSSMQSLSPSLSTSVIQLPPSPTTYCSTLPYSLSLPPSCKMSPHSSFEFKVKSCGSTPSTPTFSPIRSRSKRNVSHLKQSVLSSAEIAQIWGVFEQRQAFVSQHCTRK